jgi:hypothetical protein
VSASSRAELQSKTPQDNRTGGGWVEISLTTFKGKEVVIDGEFFADDSVCGCWRGADPIGITASLDRSDGRIRMGNDWGIFFLFFVLAAILMRLERLWKQIEAVTDSIRADLARTDGDRQEFIDSWRKKRDDAAKEGRQFWIILLIVALVAGMLRWAGFRP